MNNWKEIHSNFTDELIGQWISNDLSFEEALEWVVEVGLKPEEYDLVNYLKNCGYTAKWVSNYGDLENLRKEHNNIGKVKEYSDEEELGSDGEDKLLPNVEGEDMVQLIPVFREDKELQKKWAEKGFNNQEAEEWIIHFQLRLNEYDFASYLRKKGYNTLNLTKSHLFELRESYQEFKVNEMLMEKAQTVQKNY